MKKHFYSVVTLLLFICLSFTNNVQGKTYKIGCIEDYYPYCKMNENGEFEGLIIEWWKLWSQKTNIEVKFVPVNIPQAKQALINKEIDIIFSSYYNKAQLDSVDFADPIMKMKTVLFIKEKYETPKEIKGSIYLIESSASSKVLSNDYPFLKQNPISSISEIREQVKNQLIDGFIYDLPDAVGNFKKVKIPKGYKAFTILFTNQLRPVVAKGHTQILNDIISGSNSITSQEYDDIASKYRFFQKSKTLIYLIIAVIAFLILIIVFLLINIEKRKKSAKTLIDLDDNTDWQVILDKGENDLIEFKSSLRWDYRQEKPNKALEMVIIKTLSAFLNTQGGMLFIGVNDDGKALGLDNDYNSFSKKNRDGFLLALTNLINQHLGKGIHQFISINIISINEKDVCIINIDKSDKPVFIGKGEKEEFYIRTSAASQPLGIRESYEYIKSNWDGK